MASSFNDDLFFSSAVELNRRLRARELKAGELIRAFCERLEKVGPRLNALALPLSSDAERRAKDIDRELKRGRTRGVLQGIPFGAKDLLSVAGKKTEWGAPPYAGQIFDHTAAVLTKLDKTGAILTGKLAMIELAGGGGYRTAGASSTGPCRNPWDPSCWAGGSSSGSAAAVAAGLVPFALGSETSGSIITPAAFCGVTGLRPTYGLVSRYGAMPLSWTMDKIGPLAHTAEDCGHILAAIAGGDDRDPGSAGKGFRFFPEFAMKPPDVRVAFSDADFAQLADERMRTPLTQALEGFRSLGYQLKEAKLPEFPYSAIASTIISAEGASVFSELIDAGRHRELKDVRQAAGLEAATDIPARDYLRAMRLRRQIQTAMAEWFRDFDIIVAPARYAVASKLDAALDRSGSPANERPAGFRSLIAMGNLAGLPALCLPCGFVDGLPVALTLVSRPWNENLLLAAGMEFQKRTTWHRRRPDLSRILQ